MTQPARTSRRSDGLRHALSLVVVSAALGLVPPLAHASGDAAAIVAAAPAGSHSAVVSLTRPCTTDGGGAMASKVSGPGARSPGAVALSTFSGTVLQSSAWAGDGGAPLGNMGACRDRRYSAGRFVLTISTLAPVRVVTTLVGTRSLQVTSPSRAFLLTKQQTAADAALSHLDEIPFRSPAGAVALFAFSDYTAHAASSRRLCVRRTSEACDGSTAPVWLYPNVGGAFQQSLTVQGWDGPGFGVFEEASLGVAGKRLHMVLVLPHSSSR